ncbi:4-fold beta flower protein [Paenarthrobacter histidinolovorans]|uniref:4-fold beta flower protein n=1 Tax=Paenarthrobacter histidinolovorans TaxID=43664 RepID=UPI003898DD1F
MEAIYDSRGDVIGWLEDPMVRNLHGAVVAWHKNGTIFDLHGHERSKFSDGYFRLEGDAFAFIQGAHSGPTLPIRSIRPIRPVRHVRPVRPVFSVPSVAHVRSRNWSSKSPSEVIPGL